MALENTHYGHERIGQMLSGCHSIFFIGIGGISMSALAQISLSLGYTVGGSDRSENAQTAHLKEMGIPVFASHDAANIARYDAVVYTVAIGSDNPEYLAAQATGKPLLSRADYLGYLMVAYRHRIGVAGMHGKSTCTAMCAQIFLSATDATVLCGAELPLLAGSTCCIGKEQEHFVFEACEYMDSFLDFNPSIAVILNAEMEHVDYFKDMEHIITVLLMAWIYLTPILYPLESVPGWAQWFFKLNPMTAVIEGYHSILYWQKLPYFKLTVYGFGVAVIVLVVGELLFAKLENNFAEEL